MIEINKPVLERQSVENAIHRPEGRKSLAQLFADSPFNGLDVDFEREDDFGRDVEGFDGLGVTFLNPRETA